MTDGTNFVVLTSHRSGSTWMVDVLNNLDHTSAYSEMFLPPAEKVRDNRPFFQLQRETQNYLAASVRSYPAYNYVPEAGRRIRPFSVFRYLDNLYARPGSTGFKLMYGQLAAYPEIWLYVIAKRIKVVHLIRENLLDIIISHEYRKATRIAHTVSGERSNLPEVQIDLDPEATLARMRSMQKNVRGAQRLLEITPVPALEVIYEALKRDAANFFEVFEFLSVGDGSTLPQSQLAKIVTTGYPELIRNYDELQQRLAKSEFAEVLAKKSKE